MSESASSMIATVALAGAALLFLLQAAYAVALISAASLSRVALHRMGTDNGDRLAFLERMREPSSVQHIAAHLARQLCLLGGALLLILGLREAGWPRAVPVGAAGMLAAVVLLEAALARIVAVVEPRRALRHTAGLIRLAGFLLAPVARPMHLVLDRIEGRQTVSDEQRDEEQDEEVEALIEVGEREGLLEATEGEMMRSIVDLDETAVREIMTPRPDIVGVSVDASAEEARQTVLRTGHSRLPVYRQSLDEVVGVLYVRDLLRASDAGSEDQPVSHYMREAMFVPETLSVADLLAEMRLKTQIALVVDEYGGTAGLVTLEDLLEEIVGEIRDEHEPDETDVRPDDDGSWIINAAVHVDELTERFGIELEERSFDTVGGLVVAALGRVPDAGEKLEFRGLAIEVLEVERRRIRLVRVRPEASSDAAGAAP